MQGPYSLRAIWVSGPVHLGAYRAFSCFSTSQPSHTPSSQLSFRPHSSRANRPNNGFVIKTSDPESGVAVYCHVSLVSFNLELIFLILVNPHQRVFFSIAFQREWKGGRGKGGVRDRNINVRRTHRQAASHNHLDQGAGSKPTTQVCALDRELNRWPFSAWADTLTTEHTSQGWK